jgi:hypothetical protein
MAFHSVDDAAFFEDVTPPELMWMRDAARAAGMDIATIPLGEPSSPEVAGVSILRLPPGGILPRHAHACHRVEVVLTGSMDVGGGHVVKPGTVMISPPGQPYGPHVAGPDGVTTIEIFGDVYAETTFDLEATPELAEAVAKAQTSLRTHANP